MKPKLCDFVFSIRKEYCDEIVAKLINQEGCCCLPHGDEKNSSAWKLLKLAREFNFGLDRTILDIKSHYFLRLKAFLSGVNIRIRLTCSLRELVSL